MKDLEIDKLRIDNFSQAEGTSSQLWLSTFLVDQRYSRARIELLSKIEGVYYTYNLSKILSFSVGVGLCKGCEEVFKLDMREKKSCWTTGMKVHANQSCPQKPPQRLPLQELATNEE